MDKPFEVSSELSHYIINVQLCGPSTAKGLSGMPMTLFKAVYIVQSISVKVFLVVVYF